MRPRTGQSLTGAALLALPGVALAQEVPLWVAVGLFSPLVMLILAAILGWLRRSVATALAHALLVVAWVGAFVAASRWAQQDVLVWAPVIAYGVHGLVLLVLVVLEGLRRPAPEDTGA